MTPRRPETLPSRRPGWAVAATWRAGRRARALLQATALGAAVGALGMVGKRLLTASHGTGIETAVAWVAALALPAVVWSLVRLDARTLGVGGDARVAAPASATLLWARPLARAGIVFLVTLVFAALLAPVLTPFRPEEFGDIVAGRYLAPGAHHWLGTDQFGRDVLTRLLFGARVSLAVGVVAVLLAVGAGTLLGLLAGYLGRGADAVIMRFIDVLIAFPRLFLVLLIVSFTQPSIWVVIAVLGLTGWMGTARLVRAEVLKLHDIEFVQAARALGYPVPRILMRHVLPNVASPVIVSSTLMIGNVILAESVLSFLGLGVQVPTPSWGAMIDEGRKVFPDVWWLSTFPGIAITVTVVAFNLLGDALRDVLDPRVRLR